MPTATLNSVEVYYEVTGTGDRVVLTHGSWTDATGWAPVVDRLAGRYEVVTWDRRGHSRSQDGEGPGSRAQDAADLAALIDHVGGPVHVVGNSYGAVVTLTLVAARPELVVTAAVHEPPLFTPLENAGDPAVMRTLTAATRNIARVAELIETGDHGGAAAHFIDNVALGPGGWEQLPAAFRTLMEANALTFLDEVRDPTALSIETAALAATTVPLLVTQGTDSPALFPAIVAELARLVPGAQVHTYLGAGHLPHATHPDEWVDRLVAFHDQAR